MHDYIFVLGISHIVIGYYLVSSSVFFGFLVDECLPVDHYVTVNTEVNNILSDSPNDFININKIEK